MILYAHKFTLHNGGSMIIEGFDEEPPSTIPHLKVAKRIPSSDRPASVLPDGLFPGTRGKCNRYSVIDLNSMLGGNLLPGLHADA